MAELGTVSQTSLLLFRQNRLQASSRRLQAIGCCQALPFATCTVNFSTARPSFYAPLSAQLNQVSSWGTRAGVASENKVTTTFMVNSGGESNDILPESGSGGGNFGASGGNGGGGDNNGGGGNDDGSKGGSGESEDSNAGDKKSRAILMSQKFTLVYALLVGAGGVAGYVKSGSQKSLIAGAFSASLLYYVYSQLPTYPVFASAVGLGCSAALLVLMGSRFKKSGKIFPAGIVSFVSLVMTGGYLHGIMRSVH